MRFFVIGLAIGAALILATTATWADGGCGSSVSAAAVSPNAAATTHAGASVQPAPDWRYRWHEGRWWYWMPDNRWVYHENGRWNACPAGSVVVGNNGPVRYETGYRGPMEQGYYPQPATTYGARGGYPSPSWTGGYPGVNWGTHGSAISFGF